MPHENLQFDDPLFQHNRQKALHRERLERDRAYGRQSRVAWNQGDTVGERDPYVFGDEAERVVRQQLSRRGQ